MSGDAPVLVISPHLDDAVLSAGASIAALTGAGREVVVATVFAGEPEPPLSAVAEEFHGRCGLGPDAVAVRRREDLSALALLGATAVHLGYLDAIYRRAGAGWLCDYPAAVLDPATPLDGALVAAATGDLRELIGRHRPAAVWTCAALGSHIDHRATRHAATVAAGELGVPLLLWEDVPYAYRADGRRPPMASTASIGASLGAAHVARKVAAAASYRSQLGMLWPGGGWRDDLWREAEALAGAAGRA